MQLHCFCKFNQVGYFYLVSQCAPVAVPMAMYPNVNDGGTLGQHLCLISVNLQKNSIYVTNIECAQDVQKNPLRGSISHFPVSLLIMKKLSQ